MASSRSHGLPRVEDDRFLRGSGRYVGDIGAVDLTHAVFLRAEVAHAELTGLDTRAARQAPGVLAVITGADIRDAGLGGIPWEVRPPDPRFADVPMGDPATCAPQPLIACERVRYVGEIVAMVVARTAAEAQDAADLLEASYAALPAVIDLAAAAAAPAIWPSFDDNRCFRFELGSATQAAAAFARAHRIVSRTVRSQRIAAAPMEPRAYLGRYDAEADHYFLEACAGKPHFARGTMARDVFHIALERIDVAVPDVGGGFGAKNILYPEECLVLWAARIVGRPVRWVSTRAESLAADLPGRDQDDAGEMAFDADGRITAYRVKATSNLGAYLAPRGVNPVRHSGNAMSSVYAIPALHFEARGVFTNTAPTCSLRGTGAPEIAFLTESLMDDAAAAFGLDPIEIRRRNMIPAACMPYVTAHGIRYDSGDPAAAVDRALALIDHGGLPARRRASAARGLLRGFAVANAIEILNVFYDETAWIELRDDGTLLGRMGTQSSGQGHATVYAQLIAERLGIERGQVDILQGDTRVVLKGNGTGASRSLSAGGPAAVITADRFASNACERLAELHGLPLGHIAYADGVWRLRNSNLAFDLRGLADLARERGALATFSVEGTFKPTDGTYPYGCDACEVEVDPQTGHVAIAAYATVHDVGRAINEAIVDGQVHGSTVQGLGQALCEELVYDRDGQFLTASFLDYQMPRASDVPAVFRTGHLEVPCTGNPLGAKGVGEGGTAGAPPAIVNAILDALRPLGVRELPMPATPYAVWLAIQRASRTIPSRPPTPAPARSGSAAPCMPASWPSGRDAPTETTG